MWPSSTGSRAERWRAVGDRQRAYREPFEPLIPGVTFVPPDDVDALHEAVTERTAAIVAEPIQGEGGSVRFRESLRGRSKSACQRTGALLIADEVQCGLGRTGEAFYSPVLGLTPDLMSIGKALGSGVPIGAALVGEHVAEQCSPATTAAPTVATCCPRAPGCT